MLARQRAGDCRDHLWHNPVAIALERDLGTKACVSMRWAHVASGSLCGLHALTPDARYFLERWSRDRADQCFLLVWS